MKSLQQYAVPALGLDPVYTNTSVDFGTSDVGPLVLGMKNAGADGAWYAMDLSTNLALAQGLIQNGVKMKAQLMATGYGHELLDQPVSKTLGPDIVFTTGWAPVELKTKATKRFQADLEKYAGFTGVPDFGIYTGYIDCDLAILGLEKQGKDLDPTTYCRRASLGRVRTTPAADSAAPTRARASRPTARSWWATSRTAGASAPGRSR